MSTIAVHEALSAVFGFDTSTTSEDMCKELFLEYLMFHLQNSGAANLFSDFVRRFEKDSQDVCSSRQLSVTDEETQLFHTFLNLLIDFNKQMNQFLSTTFGCKSFEPSQIPRSLWREIQTCLACVVLPTDLSGRLHGLLEVYLRLELELAETENDCFHVFTTILPGTFDDFKRQIVYCARAQSQPDQPLTLTRFLTSLCLPFAWTALMSRVSTLCVDNYSEHFLEAILDYKEKIIKKTWLRNIFTHSEKLFTLTAPQISDSLVYRVFYEVRKKDLFSLIIEYPDSIAALIDLGKCVDHISVRRELIAHLTEEVKQRLLHPGVHTEQILVAYSYLVRALRLVDKSYLVQDVVCRPVSLCLRQREDAVRCIVDKLISAPESEKDDGSAKTDEPTGSATELHSELLLPKPLEVEPVDGAEDSDADVVAEDPPFDADCHANVSDATDALVSESDEGTWGSNWQPDPVEAMYQGGLWRRRMDLLSMLVSIYGSKKAFLVEYKQLLSQRLLKQRSFHTARELRNLELLKLRFGEQNLVECEVMLKDVRDSKRIASLVAENALSDEPANPAGMDTDDHSASNKSLQLEKPTESLTISPNVVKFPLSAFVLSVHYWPELLDERFKLPEALRHTFDQYERSFQQLKGNRTLQWMHKLGIVNIDLELDDRKVQLDVTPLQASLAHLFTVKRFWTLRDLAQELETTASNVRNSLQPFIQLGFLCQRSTVQSDELCDQAANSDSAVRRADSGSVMYQVCDRRCIVHRTTHTPWTNPVQGASGPSVLTESGGSSTAADMWMFPCQSDGLDDESVVSSVRQRKEKELQVFWSYIVAMLTNLGSLSLDRILSMLRMFALSSTSSLECNRDELRQFLDTKMREGQLTFDGENYKLIKSD